MKKLNWYINWEIGQDITKLNWFLNHKATHFQEAVALMIYLLVIYVI